MKERPDPKIRECESCGYKTTLKPYPPPPFSDRDEDDWGWFCEICACTFASNAVQYHYEDQPLFATIAYIGNLILDAVKERDVSR